MRAKRWPVSDHRVTLLRPDGAPGMAFKLKDRVRRIGQQEVCTVEDIREPDEHILRLNSGAETMYWIQCSDDIASRVFAKESELEFVE